VALIKTINDSMNTATQGAAHRKSWSIGLARSYAGKPIFTAFVKLSVKRPSVKKSQFAKAAKLAKPILVKNKITFAPTL
jgi:hypothetical protein